jgi:aromatic-L-amino-acid decarboxylase
LAPAPLTAVCFRIKDATEADHSAALTRLVEEGTAFLIPARVNGRPGIRACVTNYRTTRADIDLIVAQLADIAAGSNWAAGA